MPTSLSITEDVKKLILQQYMYLTVGRTPSPLVGPLGCILSQSVLCGIHYSVHGIMQIKTIPSNVERSGPLSGSNIFSCTILKLCFLNSLAT